VNEGEEDVGVCVWTVADSDFICFSLYLGRLIQGRGRCGHSAKWVLWEEEGIGMGLVGIHILEHWVYSRVIGLLAVLMESIWAHTFDFYVPSPIYQYFVCVRPQGKT
jgi:hypothetical protein